MYTCENCKQKCEQVNWIPEIGKWYCVPCDRKTPQTIRKDVKTWRTVMKHK